MGGAFNMIMMTIANLVGFVIGTDGIKFFLNQIFGTWEGVRFVVLCCCCLFVAVQFMFEYRSVKSFRCFLFSLKIVLFSREEELRQGIVRRC